MLSLNRYYQTMRRKYPGVIWFGDPACPEIALTFDDGPHAEDTPRVLDALDRQRIRATFFLIGKNVERYPELVQQIHQSGHQIGIHCYRHIPFPLEKPESLQRQLDQTQQLIAGICGAVPENFRAIRPPYGNFTPTTLSLLTQWGYQPVLWNCIPPHWMQPLRWTISQMHDQIGPGSVIVLHDGHGHGAKVSTIIDLIAPDLQAHGLNFVTIDNLKMK